MREIRYRLVPGARTQPRALAPWFARAPDARVHATGLAPGPDETRATLVGFAADLGALEDGIRGLAMPGATRWVVERRGAHVRVDAAWREPVMDRVRSAPRIAWDVFGDAARCAFTVCPDVSVHRILLADERPTDALWSRLLEALERYARERGTGLRCELERIAPRALPADPHDADLRPTLETAFDMGALDAPPLASSAEVADALGLAEKTVESYLAEAWTRNRA